MRAFFIPALAVPLACTQALAQTTAPMTAPDPDVQCTGLYTYLASETQAKGISDGTFEAMINKARQVHYRIRPNDNAAAFNQQVIAMAGQIRAGLANGTITFPAIQAQLAACNARYGGIAF